MQLTWKKGEHAHGNDAETLHSKSSKLERLTIVRVARQTHEKCHLEVCFPLILHRGIKQPNLGLAVGLFRRRLEAHLEVAVDLVGS